MSFVRYFLKCKDCGYMMTTLAQLDREIEGDCPACGVGSLDYAPKQDRENYIRDLLEELEFVREEEGKRPE